MRIAINALNARAASGISSLSSLLPMLDREDKENDYYILLSPSQKDILDKIPQRFKIIKIPYLLKSPFLRVFIEQLVVPFYIFSYGIDILYSNANVTILLAPCRIFLTIDNISPFSQINVDWTLKNKFKNYFLKSFGWLFAMRANRVRFVSKSSENYLVGELGINPNKCITIYHGIDSLFTKTEKNMNGKYILTVSTLVPYKNMVRLVEAYEILIRRYGYQKKLLIVGNILDIKYYEKIKEKIKNVNLADMVELTGKVKYEDIVEYYQNADLLVHPSIEETFGIPLLEAMAIGIPIAASDCDMEDAYKDKCVNPFREICGDAAVYFNPFNVENMSQTMFEVLSNDELRRKIVNNGLQRIKKFSSKNTAEKLIEVFNER